MEVWSMSMEKSQHHQRQTKTRTKAKTRTMRPSNTPCTTTSVMGKAQTKSKSKSNKKKSRSRSDSESDSESEVEMILGSDSESHSTSEEEEEEKEDDDDDDGEESWSEEDEDEDEMRASSRAATMRTHLFPVTDLASLLHSVNSALVAVPWHVQLDGRKSDRVRSRAMSIFRCHLYIYPPRASCAAAYCQGPTAFESHAHDVRDITTGTTLIIGPLTDLKLATRWRQMHDCMTLRNVHNGSCMLESRDNLSYR